MGKMKGWNSSMVDDGSGQNPNIIVFSGSRVKENLVAAFDTSGDGELSYEEAAAVTSASSIKSAFGAIKTYKSFDEFQFFTGVTELVDNMFDGWIATSITLPSSLVSIASCSFYGCTKLESLIIPEGVTSIGDSAFYGCSSLTSITIPEGVIMVQRVTSWTVFLVPDKEHVQFYPS